jgi:fructose PTS system EIIA component
MTTIDDIMSAKLISLDLDVADNFGAIDALAELLDADGRLSDKEEYVRAARAREEETGGTAMEMGIAIPHAKSGGVKEPAVAFGRTPAPIRYGDEEADLIFLIAAPEGENNLHVKILSRLARKLVHDDFRASLREAGSSDEVMEILRREVQL